MRENAYEKKALYMACKENNKAEFLSDFSAAEELLEKDYVGYSADAAALRIATLIPEGISARQINAALLLAELTDIPEITPLFSQVEDDDIPLFLPVLVKDGKRDALKNYLIQHDIYCPVHWPISELHRLNAETKKIYDEELSLIFVALQENSVARGRL